jgi:MFS family permease
VRTQAEGAAHTSHAVDRSPSFRASWRLVFAQGSFGFGYIIPATFLPVMAKQVIADPAVFGWAWPVFGAATAASTIIAAPLAARYGARRTWAASLFLMALGVVVPLVVPGLAGIIASALAVGGTFMVATMLGMQEARREAGAAARPLIGAMTAAFALGQVVGPLLVGALVDVPGGFDIALAIAAAPLMLAGYLLIQPRRKHDPRGTSSAEDRSHAAPAGRRPR